MLLLEEEARLQLLRDNVNINRAYAKGIYESKNLRTGKRFGIKKWAPLTRKSILEDLKEENPELKTKEVKELMNNMTFEEISPYITKHESDNKPEALGYNV